ncbi:hypothetical protein J8J14_04600 [Roseomonas sp. SSH11]|uniref:Uncharacterized protein n=1 Tax=Pararoseomonas baculiformis TaxID=2820812 RepID=A0ABS4AAL6_9PROT|nr:hypothetical protein [Pararoseomonas baculiformis]MBP0444050.1 hypothetical protein [Pararoseomonas baculiformis]
MRAASHSARFTRDSRLSGMVLRMISTNALAAFTQDVSRAAGIREIQPVREARGGSGQAVPAQRALESVPAAPATPLPRGSLLDLRV